MVKKILLAVLIAFSFALNFFAQNVSATASADKSKYLVGDYIYFKIQIEYNKGTNIYAPPVKDTLTSVSVIKREEPVTEEKNGREVTTYNYILSGYDSAGVTIPPIPILYKAANDTAVNTVYTNPVSFTVQTLKVNPNGGIKDVKTPIKIPLDWRLILLWVIIGLIIAAIIYYFYRRYKKKKESMQPVRKEIILPPHVVALNSLRELEDKKLWQQGKIKDYHSEITEIIRRYFEKRFELPALELTTSEAMEMLRGKKESEPIREITYDFLTNADLVKFAKYSPVGSLNEEMLKQAYNIVNKTIRLAPEDKKEEVSDVR